jgi:hypothetical protein
MRQDAKICFGGLKIISALIFCAAGMVLQVLICMRDFNKRAAPLDCYFRYLSARSRWTLFVRQATR